MQRNDSLNGMKTRWQYRFGMPVDHMGGGSEVLVMSEEPIVFRDDITIKIDGGGYCFHSWSEGLQGSAMRDADDNRNT